MVGDGHPIETLAKSFGSSLIHVDRFPPMASTRRVECASSINDVISEQAYV